MAATELIRSGPTDARSERVSDIGQRTVATDDSGSVRRPSESKSPRPVCWAPMKSDETRTLVSLNPGRDVQRVGTAKFLGEDVEKIHDPVWAVIGNLGDSPW